MIQGFGYTLAAPMYLAKPFATRRSVNGAATIRDPGKRARTQTGIPVVPVIDGVRWLAVVSVVAAHVWGVSEFTAFKGTPLWPLLSAAVASIDMFFIVSGFVMFLPAAAREGELGSKRAYAIRRVARIFPAYWVCLGMLLLFFPLLAPGHPAPFRNFGGGAVLAHLTVVQTELMPFPSLGARSPLGFGVDGALWTLSVEVCFYALLPFVARSFYRRPAVLLALAVAASALFRLEATHLAAGWLALLGYPVTHVGVEAIANSFMFQLPAFVGDFAVGMFCAYAMVRLQRRPLGRAQPTAAMIAAALALAFLALFLPSHGGSVAAVTSYYRDALAEAVAPLVLGILLLSLTLAPARITAPLSNRYIARVAEMSYGTYLYHLPLIGFAVFTLGLPLGPGAGSFLLLLAFTLLTACLMGWLSYAVVEVPMRTRGQRLAKSLQLRAAAPTATAAPALSPPPAGRT